MENNSENYELKPVPEKKQDEEKKPSEGLGIAGFIVGLVGLLGSCCCLGIPCGIVGGILSIIQLVKPGKKSGFAIAGIVLSALALLISMIFIISTFADGDFQSSLESILDSFYNSSESDSNLFG